MKLRSLHRYLTTTLVALSTLIACEQPLDVVLKEGPTRLVVEGWITNQAGPYLVKLSTTDNFQSNDPTPRISDALVIVEDDLGNANVFNETNKPGIYLSDSAFMGRVGRAYKIRIVLSSGMRYESDFQDLRPVAPIDTITYYFVEDPLPNNQERDGEGYYIVTTLTDPEPIGDFYRWKLARNRNFFDSPEDLIINTDRFVNGNQFMVDFEDFPFEKGDSCHIEQMSLSPSAFEFLRLITIQAIDIGQSTSSAPSVVIGNVKSLDNSDEIVLGFFGASAITTGNVVIE